MKIGSGVLEVGSVVNAVFENNRSQETLCSNYNQWWRTKI